MANGIVIYLHFDIMEPPTEFMVRDTVASVVNSLYTAHFWARLKIALGLGSVSKQVSLLSSCSP